jgi:hypothetical protein
MLGGGREIYCVSISITPEEVIRVYPFTSRVLKSIAIQKLLRRHRDLILSRDRYKPLFISMLSDRFGRRMYSLYNSRPQILRPGEIYSGRICISPAGGVSIEPELEGYVDTPFGRVIYSIESIEIHAMHSLELRGWGGRFHIELVTPALISSKIITYSNGGGGSSEKTELFRIPTPGSILAYSLKLWNSIAPPELRLPRPCDDHAARRYEALFAVKAEACTGVEMAEIRSVVLETGKMRDGKPKTDTGFEGQMRFKIACEDVEKIAVKTMGLAQILGIGRSRGIGLGEIKLKPHLPGHQKQTGNQIFAYKLGKEKQC